MIWRKLSRQLPCLHHEVKPDPKGISALFSLQCAHVRSLSAGLLWNESGSSLRSGGDASLGPAFTGHGRSGGAVVGAPSDDPAWFAEDSMVVGPDEGRWTVSGRPLVYLCAMCSSLCSVLLGYDVGVMSGAKEYIRPNLGLSTVQNVSKMSPLGARVFSDVAHELRSRRLPGIPLAPTDT